MKIELDAEQYVAVVKAQRDRALDEAAQWQVAYEQVAAELDQLRSATDDSE